MRRLRVSTILASAALLVVLSAPTLTVADEEAELSGAEEVPAISATGSGEFEAKIEVDTIEFELSYSGLEGNVTQAHIHFGQLGVNGGVSVFLCETASFPDPTGLAPTCPQSGTVTGVLTAANVIGPSGQGIAAGEFNELVEAIENGLTYVNVHSDLFPTGEMRGQIGDSSGDDDDDDDDRKAGLGRRLRRRP